MVIGQIGQLLERIDSLAQETVTVSRNETLFVMRNDGGSMVSKAQALSSRIYGMRNSLPTLVFIHGWPDNGSLWDEQVDHFKSKFTCLVITLPNFGEQETRATGFNHLELVDLIRAEIDAELADRPVVLVGHDWGAYLSYLFEQRFPKKVLGLITMDVGGHLKPNGLLHGLALSSYQLWLVSAWLIRDSSPRIADSMSRLIARLGRAPQSEKTRASMNYPYYFMWRSLLNKNRSNERLGEYRPHCPILYLYGAHKPFHFHSTEWIDLVEALPGSRVVALPAAHWLMRTEPKLTNENMDRWLAEHF